MFELKHNNQKSVIRRKKSFQNFFIEFQTKITYHHNYATKRNVYEKNIQHTNF